MFSKKTISVLLVLSFVLVALMHISSQNNLVDTQIGEGTSEQLVLNNGSEKSFVSGFKPNWYVEVPGAIIVDAFFGDFVQNDSTSEVAVALSNSSVIVYNYSNSDSLGSELGRISFDASNPNSTVLDNYFVTYSSSTHNVTFLNLTHQIEFEGPVNAFGLVKGDVDADGFEDIVSWNATTIYVYLVKQGSFVSKIVKKGDLSFTDSSDQFLDDLYITSRSLVLVSILDNIGGINYLNATLIKINETNLTYNNLYLNVSLAASTDFIDLFYFDAVVEDNSMEYVAIKSFNNLSGLYEEINVFSFSNKFDETANVSLTYNGATKFTHKPSVASERVEDDYWILLHDYSNQNTYGVTKQYLLKPSGFESGRLVYLYYYNLNLNVINETIVGRIPLDTRYATGLVEVQHSDGVEDLIIPSMGLSEIYIYPGSKLRDGNNTGITVYTSRNVYDVETLDIPTKSEDLIVTGESEYITVYYTPNFYTTYFQGLPSSSVFELKKYNITGDSVLDFLAIYQNAATNRYGVYVFLSDGEPPKINKVEFSPFRKTSRDYVTVKVWVSDNLGIYMVSGYYNTFLLGTQHQSYPIPFQLSQDGQYYYAQLNPVKVFPILADYTANLDIYIRDIFGNQNVSSEQLSFYSSLEVESDLPVFRSYNNALDYYYSWVYDGDSDGKDEAYIVALVNASLSVGDTVFTYIDYSSTTPYNVTWVYNSSTNGSIVGGGVGLSDDNATVAVLVTKKKIDIYYGNLSNRFNVTNLPKNATFSRISDFDGDGFDELIVGYDDSLEIYDLRVNASNALVLGTKLIGNFSYLSDVVALNNYIYVFRTIRPSKLQIYNTSNLIKEVTITDSAVYTKNGYNLLQFRNRVVSLTSNGTIIAISGVAVATYNTGTTFSTSGYSESFITDGEYIYLADNVGGILVYNSSFQQIYKNKAVYGSVPFSLALGRLENETQRELVVMYSENFLNFFNIDLNRSEYLQVSYPSPIIGGDFDDYIEYETLLTYERGVVFVHDIYKYYGLYPIVTSLQYFYDQGTQINAFVELTNLFGDYVSDASVSAVVQSPDGIESFYDLANLGWGYYELLISTDGFTYGYYNLSIKVNHQTYRDYTLNYTFVIRPVMSIYAEYEYYGEHGKDLIIDFSILDINWYPVYNATGSVTIGNLTANIFYNSSLGVYEAKFNSTDLNALPMGYYSINITANHPLATQPTNFYSTLYLQSKISVKVTISPSSLQQGENFTVITEVKDAANFPVQYASVEIYYRDIYIFDYTNSSGLSQFNETTEYWEAGNYTLDFYIYHDLSTNVYSKRFSLIVTAVPKLHVGFDYIAFGLDAVYIDLLDRYDYTLIDGTLIMELEGKNFTLNDTGSFRFEFNFTEVAPKWNFTVYFYLVNSSFAPETKFGPFYIDVLINGQVNVYKITLVNGSSILYQGEKVNITVLAVDSFSNPIDYPSVSGYVYINGRPYILNNLGNGYYFTILDTKLWRYGKHIFEAYILWDRLYKGYVSQRSEFVLTAIPNVIISSLESYGNKSVSVEFRVVDKFGNPIESATLTITSDSINQEVSVSLGEAKTLMDFSNKAVGERTFKVSLSGKDILSKDFNFTIPVKTEVDRENVNIIASGLLTNETGEYPADSITQGETLYVNITVLDDDGLAVPNLRVRVIFGGTSYSIATTDGKTFMVQIITENMPAGHYSLIVQVSGAFIILKSGSILSIEETIYIKPEIHYKVDIPESIIEGQEFNVTVAIRDKYGNPLEPIEGRTSVLVVFQDEAHFATYYPDERAFVVTLLAPYIGDDEIVEGYPISVFIDYEGIGKENAIKGQRVLSVKATPPITEESLDGTSSIVGVLALLATLIVLSIYLITRYKAFDEKIIKLTYILLMFGAIGSLLFSLGLFAIGEYGYAEFAVLVSFMAIFPWYGLQIRLDQLKLIKASRKLIEGNDEAEISINKLNYLAIYLFGAMAIYVAFDVIGSQITWFSRYILAGLKTPIGLYFITGQTIAFYLFAARGIYMKSLNYLNELVNKKIPSIRYASSQRDKFMLFQDIVADSINIMGSYVLTTAVYTLYLLSTTIWGVSRLPSLGLSPLTLILLLTPITLPILVIWVLQYVKLPKEPSVQEFVFAGERASESLKGDTEEEFEGDFN